MEIYAAMVSDLDGYIGRVVDYLKEIGEYENTFIVFASDNGPEAGRMDLSRGIQQHVGRAYDHSLENLGSATSYVNYGPNWASASASPFNRHKFTAFEGGVRVPALVHHAGNVPAGTQSDAVVTIMDLLPTFLALAGAEHPGTPYRGRDVLLPQGRSLLPMLRGETDAVHPADHLFGWELFGHRGVRVGEWKLVWDQALPPDERHWQLFDLGDDPFEQNDLSATRPEKLAEMIDGRERYEEENGVIY
jgi:arylsulfatase A-like enzyme